MKYIDTEKLIERLEEMKQAEYENCGGVNSKTFVLQEVQELIDSLQQKQLPGIEEHGVPGKDFIPVEWVDACEKYGKWKIVQQEQPKMNIPSAGSGAMGTTPPKFKLDVKPVQPEVDLEKEIDDYIAFNFSEAADGILISDANSTELQITDVSRLASHFYELGKLNARKEK